MRATGRRRKRATGRRRKRAKGKGDRRLGQGAREREGWQQGLTGTGRRRRKVTPHFVGHPCVWQSYSFLGPQGPEIPA
jgi:hypothetical protein